MKYFKTIKSTLLKSAFYSAIVNLGIIILYGIINDIAKVKLNGLLDAPHFITLMIVLSALVDGIIVFKKYKDDDSVFGTVTLCAVLSLVCAFIGATAGLAFWMLIMTGR